MTIDTGQRYEENFVITFDQVKRFAEITGDSNPIHLDEAYAKACGFEKPIVHGFLSGSVFSKILGTKFPSEGTIYLSQAMSFKAPVFPDEPLVAELEVVSGTPKGKYVIRTIVRSGQGNQIKIEGEAHVLYRKANV